MTCPCPPGSCPGCYESAFGLDVGPGGARTRAGLRGGLLGGVAGAMLGGPGGLLVAAVVTGLLSALFSDRIDTFLRTT